MSRTSLRPDYIASLSSAERSRFDEWADKWIEVGLRTGPPTDDDRSRFEAAARKCYEAAGIKWPGVVVWVPSPVVLAFAAPIAALLIQLIRRPEQGSPLLLHGAVDGAVRGAVRDAVGGTVGGAVNGAVRVAVNDAVNGAVRGAVAGTVRGAVADAVAGTVRGAVADAVNGAVRGAVGGAVNGAVRDAVNGAVRDAVKGAVNDAVDGAVNDAAQPAVNGAVRDAVNDAVNGAVRGAREVRRAVLTTVSRAWHYYMGGQFWVGGWGWHGNAYTSFFREVAGLRLGGDLWQRSLAYDEMAQTACWSWPHRDFIMVCEHPSVIHRELVDPSRPRGWGSHRLHCDDGPAVGWRDGWGVWAIHGVRVPQQVVEAPETLTPAQIRDERNAEVRRIMLDRFGTARYIREIGAEVIHRDDWGTLYRAELPDDEPLVMVEVVNSTAEPDGTYKDYWLRVEPSLRPMLPDGSLGRPQKLTALNAVASTFGLTGRQYKRALVAQT